MAVLLLLVRSPDEPSAPADGMGRQRGDAHRHDSALGGRQRADGRQELVGPGAVDHAQDRVAALGQTERPLAPVLGLLVALDEPAPDQAVDQPARRRGERPIASASSPTVRVLPSART